MVLDRTPLAESRGLLLAFAKGVGSDMVEGDLGLLNQVLSVFLTNALNYTPSGGQVVVKTGSLLEDEAWVGFSVSDTGPGISPDELPHLSERFFRGNAGRQSGAPGTGLGLAIAREIIDRHAGKLTIQSSGMPGEGTTMSAWLPLLKKGPGTRDSQER
jgi:signal transduction histidine kinase